MSRKALLRPTPYAGNSRARGCIGLVTAPFVELEVLESFEDAAHMVVGVTHGSL